MLSIRKYVESVAGEETEPNVFDERDRAVSLLDSEEDVSSARRRVNEDSDDDASSWSRCVTENPDAEAISEMEEVVRRRRGNDDGANETFVVDVYFHVIHILGGRGDLRTSVIEEQMKVLNDTFVRGYSDSYPNDCAGNAVPAAVDDDVDDEHHGRTRISFRLVEVTRTRNLLWFYQSFEYEEDIKNALHKGTCADLNVYSVGFCGGLGKSSWPTTCARDPTKDGVMIHFQTVPGGGYEDYEQGDTLVHEVGHWLGLSHTFSGGCYFDKSSSRSGRDNVQDTPREASAHYGCETGRDTCPDHDGLDPTHNFMDYSDDCCMYEFTPEQRETMRAIYAEYRRPAAD